MTLRISAKQITLFGQRVLKEGRIGGCPRQWAAMYLDKLRPEFLPQALVDGIKFHAVCASLVTTGKMPEPHTLQPGVYLTENDCLPDGHFGKMGRAALIHLPRYHIDVPFTTTSIQWMAEQVWLFPWVTNNGVKCSVDLRPDLCANYLGALSELVDFKSTSDKRYALDSLQDDVQANLYAYGLMKRFEHDDIRASWIYVNKKTYAAWRIQSTFVLDAVTSWLHNNVDATIELIATIRDNPAIRALDLPGDETANCRFCDFQGQCLDLHGPKEPRLITLEEINRYRNAK